MNNFFKGLMAFICLITLHSGALAGSWTNHNFIYKPQLGARGATEKATFDAGLDRVDARLGKEIWVGDPNYGVTLQDAVTALGSTQATLRLASGIYNISGAFTIPANLTLKPERGAQLNIAAGQTLVLRGLVEAGRWQIFSGPGRVKYDSPNAYLVEWRGVRGDNASDNSVDLQAVFDDLKARDLVGQAAGCEVSFGAGHYKFSQKISIQGSGIYTTGMGSGSQQTVDCSNDYAATVLEYTGTDAALEAGNGTNVFSGIKFSGFRLLLSGALAGTVGINYLTLCHTNCNVDDVYIRGSDTGDIQANWKGVGIKYGNQCQSNQVAHCGLFYLDLGLVAYGLNDNLAIDKNKFIRTRTAGVKLGDSSSPYDAGWGFLITGNHFGQNGKSVWCYRSPRPGLIQGNYFENSWDANDLAIVVGDASYKAYGVTIESNVLSGDNAANYGIDLVNADGCYIIGNTHNDYKLNLINNSGLTNNDHIFIYHNSRYDGSHGDISSLSGVQEIQSSYDYGHTFIRNSAGQIASRWKLAGDSYDRLYITGTGLLKWGSGNAVVDTGLERKAAGIIGPSAGSKLSAQEGLCLPNYVNGDVTGTAKTRKVQVFDGAGNSVGYLQIFSGP